MILARCTLLAGAVAFRDNFSSSSRSRRASSTVMAFGTGTAGQLEFAQPPVQPYALKLSAIAAPGTPDELRGAYTSYRYGSFPPVVGKHAIRQATYSSHLDFVKGMAFEVLETWAQGDTVIAELELRHELIDGTTLTLLCTDVVRFAPDGKVRDFRVYIDPSPLFARAKPRA